VGFERSARIYRSATADTDSPFPLYCVARIVPTVFDVLSASPMFLTAFIDRAGKTLSCYPDNFSVIWVSANSKRRIDEQWT
jgi:hypothetical protein